MEVLSKLADSFATITANRRPKNVCLCPSLCLQEAPWTICISCAFNWLGQELELVTNQK